ncbi:MAG: sugar hydrolase [Kiritimatiellaceae bacterium]|nr:sugar hydrolase [Kiritimatiellaceae bacterium]
MPVSKSIFNGAREQVLAQRKSWVETAQASIPPLYEKEYAPVALVSAVRDSKGFQGWRMDKAGTPADYYQQVRKEGDSAILDFGTHLVGTLRLSFSDNGRHIDAPVKLRLVLGEMPAEVGEDVLLPCDTKLSRSWYQEEIVHVDVIPGVFELPRRYAFRYLRIDVLTVSGYSGEFRIDGVTCKAVTSGDEAAVAALPSSLSQELKDIDAVALRTLRNCMQTVLEDGPKRDRRLWLGDFYLQAQANHASFRNNQLIKRCLYLLGGLCSEQGIAATNCYENPEPAGSGLCALDYVALYIPTLRDYCEASGDWESARELWPLILVQIEKLLSVVDADGIFRDPEGKGIWVFVDWHTKLNKEVSFLGILIFALEAAAELADRLGEKTASAFFTGEAERLRGAARKHLFDSAAGLFISGPDRQISWSSQAWMVLSKTVTGAEAQAVMRRAMDLPSAIRPAGPYLYHYIVEALFRCGLRDEAEKLICNYWGDMVRRGADCFWEVYDPADDFLSPYNSHQLNSYCHAWSCTPTYFIRNYLV